MKQPGFDNALIASRGGTSPRMQQPTRSGSISGRSTAARSVSKAEVIAQLGAVARKPLYSGNERAWDAALKVLNVPLKYQPAVGIVLGQHRWRNAQNPRAYVATAAQRLCLSLGLADFSERNFRRISASQANDDGEWGADIPADDDNGGTGGSLGNSEERDERQDFDPYQIPGWLQHEEQYDRINWETVARYAAPKPAMVPALRATLELRFGEHLSRRAAIGKAAQRGLPYNIEATWKWIDRNWATRILPLFHMERPPVAPSRENAAAAKKSTARLVSPWDALRKASAREKPKTDWIHAPSLMQEKRVVLRPSAFPDSPTDRLAYLRASVAAWGDF